MTSLISAEEEGLLPWQTDTLLQNEKTHTSTDSTARSQQCWLKRAWCVLRHCSSLHRHFRPQAFHAPNTVLLDLLIIALSLIHHTVRGEKYLHAFYQNDALAFWSTCEWQTAPGFQQTEATGQQLFHPTRFGGTSLPDLLCQKPEIKGSKDPTPALQFAVVALNRTAQNIWQSADNKLYQ